MSTALQFCKMKNFGDQFQDNMNILDTTELYPILWPPDVKSRFTATDPDAGKD